MALSGGLILGQFYAFIILKSFVCKTLLSFGINLFEQIPGKFIALNLSVLLGVIIAQSAPSGILKPPKSPAESYTEPELSLTNQR